VLRFITKIFKLFFKIVKNDDGELSLTIPYTKTITAVDINQLGIPVVAMLNHPDKFNGKNIQFAGEHASPQSYVDTISEKIGKKITLKLIPVEEFAKFPFPMAEDIAHMFGYFDEHTFFASKSWKTGKELFPSTHTFKDWIKGVDFAY